jgi:glycosyltransferase involved in cell wall biosynthesis
MLNRTMNSIALAIASKESFRLSTLPCMDYAPDSQLISIIIPTKDRCSLLLETLDSVRNQTYKHWEAIVLDDLSRDDTWPVLEELARLDSRIRPVLRTGEIGGAAVARNQGFSASCGSFILFLDSDDLLGTSALEERMSSFDKSPTADAIVGDAEYFRRTPGENHEECTRSNKLLVDVDALDAFLTSGSPWFTSGPLWKRSSVEKAGPWTNPYDNHYHTYSLVKGLRFVRTGIVDWYVRLHDRPQVSRSFIADFHIKLEMLDEMIQLLRSNRLLTRRRKRMLAWRCMLETLTCAYERALPSIKETLALLEEARRQMLFGTTAFAIAAVLTRLQWSGVLGPAPREIVRLSVYLDLKRHSPFTKEFGTDLRDYIRYLAIHFRGWRCVNRQVMGERTS